MTGDDASYGKERHDHQFFLNGAIKVSYDEPFLKINR